MTTTLSTGRAARTALALAAAFSLSVACGDDGSAGDDDDDSTPTDGGRRDGGPRLDGGPNCGVISAAPDIFAGSGFGLEGQRAWVLSLDARGDDNFSCARVEPDPDFVTVGLMAQKCNRRRCGIVLTVPDLRPNGFMGSGPLPTPEFADGLDITVKSNVDNNEVPTRLSILWLDEFDSSEGGEIRPRAAVQVISGFRVLPGASFSVIENAPLRIFSMSGGTFAANIDVSTAAQAAVAGGGQGGAPFMQGGGAGGGGAAFEAAGAGGGNATAGDPGGPGAEAGAANGDAVTTCAQVATDTNCGGSGGGGSFGPGGGGGGTIFLGALGHLNLSSSTLDASGGDGVNGGGGGSGGNVMVTATSWDPPDAIEVRGGIGGVAESIGQQGGSGAPGRIRVDVPGEEFAGATTGLTLEVSETAADYLVEDPEIVLRGTAQPGSIVCATDIVRVEDFGEDVVDAMTCARQFTGPDGRYEIPITLRPGLSRFRVQSGSNDGVVNCWVGNNILFDEGFPTGASLDYVYVPDAE